MFVLSILMLIFSDFVYKSWLGKGKVHIDFILSFWGLLYVAVNMFGSKYVYFLNGISALKIQFWSSIFSPILYVAIAILFIHYYKMGAYSLFVAAIIANIYAFIAPIQYYQIIIKNKKGIWTR